MSCPLPGVMSFIFPPGEPQFVPSETNFVVKHTWEISSKEDGGERRQREGSTDKNWELARRSGISQLREKSTADSSKFLDCGANHEKCSEEKQKCGENREFSFADFWKPSEGYFGLEI